MPSVKGTQTGERHAIKKENQPLFSIGRSFFRTDSFQNRKPNLESESRLEPIARTNNTPATRLATLVGLVGKARDLILSLRIGKSTSPSGGDIGIKCPASGFLD